MEKGESKMEKNTDLNSIKEDLEKKKKDKSNRKYKIAILIMIIIILLLLCFKCTQDPVTDTIFDDPIPMAQGEDYQKMLDSAVAESMMNVNYLPYVEMQSDGMHSEVFQVNNSPNNHDLLKFYLYDENNNKIYESAEIPQGYQLNNITLNKALSKGEHECVIELHYAGSDSVSSKFPIIITVP